MNNTIRGLKGFIKSNGGLMIFAAFTLIFGLYTSSSPVEAKGRPGGSQAINWTMSTIILDNINASTHYTAQMAEAIAFIKAHSRFNVVPVTVTSGLPHTYTYYDCPNGPQTCVIVNKWDVATSTISALPTKDSYMILWNALTHPPLQAGSTWGVADGILKGGIGRPYATIAVDPWWYLGATNDGFTSTGARIIAHEIINSIGSKLEVAPYNCAPLTADPSITRAGDWEASRLAKITSSCYTKYTSTRTK